jgi:hypothetical protein
VTKKSSEALGTPDIAQAAGVSIGSRKGQGRLIVFGYRA